MQTYVQNKQGATYSEHVKMCLVHCAECGIPFAMPDEVEDRRRRDHGGFYCPNGHNNYYPEGTGTKEQIELRKVRQELEAAKCESQGWKHLKDADLEPLPASEEGQGGVLEKILKELATKEEEARKGFFDAESASEELEWNARESALQLASAIVRKYLNK